MATDPPILYRNVSGTIKGIIHGYDTLFKGCRCSYDLENTAGLIGIIQTFISPHGIQCIIFADSRRRFICIGQFKRMIQIKLRHVYHRIDLSV